MQLKRAYPISSTANNGVPTTSGGPDTDTDNKNARDTTNRGAILDRKRPAIINKNNEKNAGLRDGQDKDNEENGTRSGSVKNEITNKADRGPPVDGQGFGTPKKKEDGDAGAHMGKMYGVGAVFTRMSDGFFYVKKVRMHVC